MSVAAMAVNGARKANVLLVGLGSVGSVYAYMLERSGKAQVTALARSNYDLYAKSGLTLRTSKFGTIDNWKPYKLFRTQPEALAEDVFYDICLICTKCLPDVLPTTEMVKDVIASKKVGAWALIQNGLGVEEGLYQAVKDLDQPILSSCAWIGVMTNGDGSVVDWNGQDVLVTGIYPPLDPVASPQTRKFTKRETDALELWNDILTSGGGKLYLEDRITSIRYSKNVWNCMWSSIESLTRTTPHTFEPLTEEQRAPLKQLANEIVQVGYQSGLLYDEMIQYPGGQRAGPADLVAKFAWERVFEVSCQKYHSGGQPHMMSMMVDVLMGKPFEVEVIVGEVLKVAQQHGIATPLLAYTYALLKGIQLQILRKAQIKPADGNKL